MKLIGRRFWKRDTNQTWWLQSKPVSKLFKRQIYLAFPIRMQIKGFLPNDYTKSTSSNSAYPHYINLFVFFMQLIPKRHFPLSQSHQKMSLKRHSSNNPPVQNFFNPLNNYNSSKFRMIWHWHKGILKFIFHLKIISINSSLRH